MTLKVQITKARWARLDLGVALRALTLEAQIEQAQGVIGKGAAPISVAGGELSLRDDDLLATKLRGVYGNASQFSDASVSLKKLSAKNGPVLDASIHADVDLGDDLIRLLTALTPTSAESFSQVLTQQQGRATTRFRVQRAGAHGKLTYGGVITLQQAKFACCLGSSI
jgi:hypothetical protein